MPISMTLRQDLTDYAFGLLPDFQHLLDLADLFAPRVPTGTTTGRYTIFNSAQAFLAYDADRGLGGTAQRIKFGADVGTFDATPKALEVGIDDEERNRAGEAGFPLLERAKTRTLVSNACVSHLNKVMTVVSAGVAAVANRGVWSDPNTDPLAELDEQMEAILNATGILPNNIAMDFGPWRKLRNHPKVRSRMPGAARAVPSMDDIAAMLTAPNVKMTLATARKATAGFKNTDDSKTAILGSNAYLFYSSPAADQYDPSFCKAFSVRPEQLTAVRTYRDETVRSDILALDWSNDIEVVSASLARRLAIT